MSDPMSSHRIVDDLLVLDAVDDFDDVEFDYAVVEDLLQALAELDDPDNEPSPVFLAEMIAAIPAPATPARRGVRIAVVSGALVLAAAGSAAAANGSLPAPVQSAAHAVARAVGVDIPDGRQGPPESSGSQDGPGHGRSDEAPGRPDDPGQPADPGRSDEAPGAPADPGSGGVGPDGTPPGQIGNEHPDPPGIDNPNAGGGGGGGGPESQGEESTGGTPTTESNPDTDGGNPNAGGGNPNAGGGNPNASGGANGNGNHNGNATANGRANGHIDD
jgi:hypothetical protein